MLYAVIMAGGTGTRFWPASRRACPKQLLDLAGGQTMIQSTVNRLKGLVGTDRVLIVTNEQLVPSIRDQLPQLPPSAVLGEPAKRDTAPCIGVAAHWVLQRDPTAVMVVMPADHVIEPVEQFQQAVQYAEQLVERRPSRLVTFGIRPSYPAESFGYIQRGEPLAGTSDAPLQAFQVESFREKPQADVARRYLQQGCYDWNSGIFVWRAQTILEQLRRHEPTMSKHLETIAAALETPLFDSVFHSEFPTIVGKSIDFAVMERATEVVVVEAPFSWDDVGSWQALSRLRGVDDQGNTIRGRHLGIDTEGTIVRSDDEHLVVTVGLKDCLVVHTPDATLVANKHDEERIRQVVRQLEERQWTRFL
jgi:mannose-1-phosphate guanylyltransferase